MTKRLFDIGLATLGLALTWPLIVVGAVAVKVNSKGPVIYRAIRAGRGGRPFTMHKLRTMAVAPGGPSITAPQDPRVFPAGRVLRALKLDELPQLYDVIRGEMSLVGPRPEDPRVVREHYTERELRTLEVRPGITSPGILYEYTHGAALLAGLDTERAYTETLLHRKLELDIAYVANRSLASDIGVIARTLYVIVARALGRRSFRDPFDRLRPAVPRPDDG